MSTQPFLPKNPQAAFPTDQNGRIGHDGQPGDAMGGSVQGALSQRASRRRGQRLRHGAARADRGGFADWSDVQANGNGGNRSLQQEIRLSPSSIPVAVDALAVYVNKANPIECLTLAQVDQIFSKDHWNSSSLTDIRTWGEAGLSGDWLASRSRYLAGTPCLGRLPLSKIPSLCTANSKMR